MKHMRIVRLCFFSLALCLSIGSRAQSEASLSSIAQSLDSVFENLCDTTKIKTGFLRDKAIDLVRLNEHTGQALTDSNYVDALLFRDLFRTMNYARIAASTPQYNADSLYSALATLPNGSVKLRTALFRYHFIKSGAISDGLINYNQSSNKASYAYTGSNWINPFDSTCVFMFTSGASAVEGNSVSFNVADIVPIGNCAINSVYIDFDDGNGYVPVSNIQSHSVFYASEGTKNLTAKVSLTGNVELLSRTQIEVYPLPVSPSSGGGTIDAPDVCDTVCYNGISAVYSIKYHTNHGGKIKKPFIYVEGFDHPVLAELADFNFHSIPNIINNTCRDYYNYSSVFEGGLKTYLTDQEYDFIYVDWKNPEADIRLNAVLLENIIDIVNGNRPSDGSDGRGILVGHSMGGLIGRWALCEMEHNHQNHMISCFATQDTPHLGAVVPIGIQYTIRDIYSGLFGQNGSGGIVCNQDIKAIVDRFVGVLDCMSARQMMYNYIDPNGNLNNEVHNAWQSQLDGIGFPKGDNGYSFENLAIVSGGDLGSSELNQSIISSILSISDFGVPRVHFAFNNLTCSLFIDRDRGVNQCVSRTLVSYLHLSEISLPAFFILNRERKSPTGASRHDLVRGSYLGADDFNGVLIPLPQFLLSLFGNAKIVFIPTASALSVDNYNTDYYTNPPTPLIGCPFSSYCMEQDPMRHDNKLYAYVDWIDNHASMSMNGPESLILSGDYLSISNPPNSVPLAWSTSNSSSVSISNSGQVTVLNSDVVSVRNSGYIDDDFKYNGISHPQRRHYIKTRTVLAGFPSMTLNDIKVGTNQYEITASETTGNQRITAMLDTLVSRGKIRYIWGIKNGDNTTNWADTTSVRTYTCTAPNGVNTTVCMKIREMATGRESAENLIVIVRYNPAPYYTDPSEVLVDQLGTPFMQYNYVSGLNFLNYFAVWVNSYYDGTVPVPDNVLVGSEQVSLTTSFQQSIDGEMTTVYCFDILSTTTMQNGIADFAVNGDGGLNAFGVSIRIRSGTTELMYMVLPFVSYIRPFYPHF